MNPRTKKILTLAISVVVVIGVIFALYLYAGKEPFIRTTLSG